MIELEIETYAPPGVGLGKFKGMNVTVPLTTIGDRVQVEPISEKKNHIFARLIEVIDAGPDRIEAPCPHYGVCGGCTLMHLPYQKQLQIKHTIFEKVLQSKGLNSTLEMQPSKEIFAYRYKANLKAGNGAIGFCQSRSEFVVSVPECKILSEGIRNRLQQLAAFKDHKADYPILESQAKGGVAAVRTRGKRQTPLSGFPHAIMEDYGFGEMEMQAGNFVQANPFVTREIAKQMITYCNKEDVVVEFYSGSGTFSIPLAQHCKRLFSYEIDKRACAIAERNLQKQSLFNVTTTCQNVSKIEIPSQISLIVADPPRSGIEANLINKIVDSSAERMLYVSCNTNSLGRDLIELTNRGSFTIKSIRAFDMYCHTTHLESLTLLER